jgi:lipopolysaccharide/colanic/teichoic acid biosynthesis glycosyltransferase
MVKRAVDIVMASLGMLILIPFWPLIALGIKIESKGPVLFKQVRLGHREKHFSIYKFRTMRNEQNDFAPTSVSDARITKLGNILRKTRLDELPQMINILKGDMSFIGPRPERPELAEGLSKVIPFYRQRHMVKPGVTGWDQVSGEYHSPSVEDTYKKLQYDLYYVRNLSPFLDVSIFFKTIMTVVARAGR